MHQHAEAPRIDHGSIGEDPGTVDRHDQRHVGDIEGRMAEAVDRIADRIGAVAAVDGLDQAVLHIHPHMGRVVGGQRAPALRADMAVGVIDRAVVDQIGGAHSAGQAQHPRHLEHLPHRQGECVAGRLDAVAHLDIGMVEPHGAVAADEHGGAHDPRCADLGVMHRDVGVAGRH